MVVKCLLCLEYPTIPGPKFLEIFGDDGLRLDISSIINKHFWLKTNRNGDNVQQICLTCWEVVRDFHILYQRVEEVHKHLELKTIVLDDPLPQDVMLKSEEDPSMAQDPIMSDNCLGDSIFDSEVKVEVHDLDLLPQIEILETEEASISERTTRSNRRGRPPANRDQSPKLSTKRIKKEQSPANDKDLNLDVFSENEPFIKDTLNTSGSLEDINKSLLSSSLDVKEDNSSKKRGRPRKGDLDKSKTVTPRTKRTKKQQQQQQEQTTPKIKNEKDAEEDEPSCSSAQPSGTAVAQIKTENSGDEPTTFDQFPTVDDQFEDAYAHDDDEDDDDDNDNDNDNLHKPSDDSSNLDSGSEDSNASDWVEQQTKKEKYAVIKKKERNTPKKYKKREKPAVEPKRMSREEIEARQAQQAEYDNIITKFFDKIRCPKCELLVHTFGEMRAHFRIDHNDDHGFVECCGRRFATRKFLAEHILVHYNPDHFKCKTCDKVCRDSSQLESHEQTHLPNPPASKYKKTFQCEKCSKTFSSKASFEHHMVAKHVPREEFKFECPECKKKFASAQCLKIHAKTHTTLKPYICDQCGLSFKKTSHLNKHHRYTHTGEKKPPKIPQQCTFCNKWYSCKSQLQQHVKHLHTNTDVENRCETCGHVSTTAKALKKHIANQHDEHKYKHKCNLCEKQFKTLQGIREHIATHTGEALYKCNICAMPFKCRANLFHHRRRLHKAEVALEKQIKLAQENFPKTAIPVSN